MQYEIRLSRAAKQDLADVYDYLAERSSPARAIAYIERVGSAIASLQRFPERGTKRDDIRNNLRVLGFERRVSIAFFVENRS